MATPFVVNLADGDGTPHFAKVGVALRFSKLSEGEIPPRQGREGRPRWRPTPSCATSSSRRSSPSTSGDLDTPTGREKVKKLIVARVNKQTDIKITDVYYTEFAVQ